jgi:hypothetical protein
MKSASATPPQPPSPPSDYAYQLDLIHVRTGERLQVTACDWSALTSPAFHVIVGDRLRAIGGHPEPKPRRWRWFRKMFSA